LAQKLVISIDAMGGDYGPTVAIGGAARALERHPGIYFLLHGDKALIEPLLEPHEALKQASEIRHAASSIAMDVKPGQALRHGRDSSMGRAIASVAEKEAAVAVSSGNTGALMALAMFQLRTLPGIDRPAIAAIWPTLRGESVVLDCGANVDCSAGQLVDFAVMGAAFAQVVFGLKQPSVGLLNIGSEEIKGHEQVKRAAQILRGVDLPMVFHGFVEGDDIGAGAVDVVVTDGFTGNIALKTAEGTAKLVVHYLSAALKRSLFSRLGALFAAGALRMLKTKLDPRAANGGVFLGLQGVVVKSHGGTDALGFAAALDLAVDMAAENLPSRIAADIAKLAPELAAAGLRAESAAAAAAPASEAAS
jgi:glycerol-3-phosphate acyltransferase PlsX